jgi:hypothetical protein
MENPSISWRPEKLVSDQALVDAMRSYGAGKGNFRIYENGTVLFIKAEFDTDADAHRCLEELAFSPDFNVLPMKNGNFFVSPHSIGAVLILADEIGRQLEALTIHKSGALYPEERFFLADENLPIGLVGRAKLCRDSIERNLIYHHEAVSR